MKNQKISVLVLSLLILNAINESKAKPDRPITEILETSNFLSRSRTQQWIMKQRTMLHEIKLQIAPPIVLAAALCFIAASISSAGGIGGGGLFIPILTIVSGLDLKTASSFSAFMVTGGSFANVLCNIGTTSSKFGCKPLIDYDIALSSEPCMLLGVSTGVICNVVFPEWLITTLFATFLAWSTLKTCRNGMLYWKLESEENRRIHGCEILETGLVKDAIFYNGNDQEVESSEEPLLGVRENSKLKFPWMKLGVLVLVWFSFYLLSLLRGNRYGQGIVPIKPCGVAYWLISSLEVPLAIAFTLWILYQKESPQCNSSNHKDTKGMTIGEPSSKLIFTLMALLAGILGGMFGIGGGMLISPLLLHVGIKPEVTAATCSFMVFFSSTMSACKYLLLGMDHADIALILAVICFVASLLGSVVVQRAIRDYGRASLIVFSVSTVMALSTVLMTYFGSLDVWCDYVGGKYMGFKPPC